MLGWNQTFQPGFHVFIVSFVVSNYFDAKKGVLKKEKSNCVVFQESVVPRALRCSVMTDLQGTPVLLKELMPLLSSTAQLSNLWGPSVSPKVSEH